VCVFFLLVDRYVRAVAGGVSNDFTFSSSQKAIDRRQWTANRWMDRRERRAAIYAIDR